MDVNLRLALVELAYELRQESLLELQLGQARLEAVRQVHDLADKLAPMAEGAEHLGKRAGLAHAMQRLLDVLGCA